MYLFNMMEKKKAETLLNSFFTLGKGDEASIVHPDFYAQRFIEFISGVLVDEPSHTTVI